MARHPTAVRIKAWIATLRLAARALRLAELGRSRRLRRQLRRLGLPVIALALAGAPLAAQPGTLLPVLPVEPVLLDAVGFNSSPDVAASSRGQIVTVWADEELILGSHPLGGAAPAASESNHGILFQRALPDGTRVGEIGLVSDSGSDPAVAVDDGDGFVVVWDSGADILYHRFNTDGAPLGRALPATNSTTETQSAPDIAGDADGDFVITWREEVTVTEEPTSKSLQVRARRFNADGSPAGEAFTVGGLDNLTDGSSIASSAVAMGDGGPDQAAPFIVAWSEYASTSQVVARLYGAGPTPIDIVVDDVETNRAFSVDVAMDADGDFVISWLDESSDLLAVQRYDPNGLPQGKPVRVFDTSMSVNIQGQSVAMDADGDFVVAWLDSASEHIRARRFGSDGAPEDAQQPITVESGSHHPPAVAMDADGDFVVAWQHLVNNAIHTRSYLRPAVLVNKSDDVTQVAEGGGTDTVSLGLSLTPSAPVTVTLTPDLPQIDLGAGPGVPQSFQLFPFSEGSPTRVVTLRAVDDSAIEGFHTARLSVSASGPGSGYERQPLLVLVDGVAASTITISIADNEAVDYTVSTSTAGTNEGSGELVIFTLRRGLRSASGTSSVRYRFGGSATFGEKEDYWIGGGTAGVRAKQDNVIFRNEETEKTLIVKIADDQRGEPSKSIVLEIGEPQPEGIGRVAFPVAVVTLGDNDLAEVRVEQTGGNTEVTRGGKGDQLMVALRTVPVAPVSVVLTPSSRQLNLDAGWGNPRTITFAADVSALEPQMVPVFTAPSAGLRGGELSERLSIRLAASSADPGYGEGARFTVDGKDSGEVPVELEVPPGSGEGISSLFLPLVRR